MPRNRKIEEILDAWWDLDHCETAAKAESKERLDRLLDAIIAGTDFTREQVLDNVWGHYAEYRIARRSTEKVQIARSASPKK